MLVYLRLHHPLYSTVHLKICVQRSVDKPRTIFLMVFFIPMLQGRIPLVNWNKFCFDVTLLKDVQIPLLILGFCGAQNSFNRTFLKHLSYLSPAAVASVTTKRQPFHNNKHLKSCSVMAVDFCKCWVRHQGCCLVQRNHQGMFWMYI